MNFSEQFVGNCKHKGVVEDFLWSRPASFFEQSETTKETTLEEITGPETGDGMSGRPKVMCCLLIPFIMDSSLRSPRFLFEIDRRFGFKVFGRIRGGNRNTEVY